MDSSNAEKAWRAHAVGNPAASQVSFMAGRASRDAEVAEPTGVIDSSARTYEELETEHTAALTALAEARARYGDLEVQLAEAHAVIEKVRADAADWLKAPRGEMAPCTGVGRYFTALVSTVPSVVLEDRDREVAARAVEAVARDLAEPAVLWWSNFYGPQVCTDEAAGAKLSLDDWFAQRAAAIRKGDTNA